MRRAVAGAAALLALPLVPAPAVAEPERLGDRPLARGDRGPDVRELQRTLRRLRLRTSVDGVFGRATASRVRRYERRYGILRDGDVSVGQARGMRKRAGLPFAGDPSRGSARVRSAPSPSGAHFPIQGDFRWGEEGSAFGDRGGGHRGVDVFAECGTPLVAPMAGTVRHVKTHEAAGHYVVLQAAATGEDHVLMHLNGPATVQQGAEVAAGQPIGEVGRSGNATACHLHFEIWTAPGWYRGGEARDPEPDLRSWSGQGSSPA